MVTSLEGFYKKLDFSKSSHSLSHFMKISLHVYVKEYFLLQTMWRVQFVLSSENKAIRKRSLTEHFDIRKKKNKEDSGISSLKYSSIYIVFILIILKIKSPN